MRREQTSSNWSHKGGKRCFTWKSNRQFTFKFLLSLLRVDLKEQRPAFYALYHLFISSPSTAPFFNPLCLPQGLSSSPLRVSNQPHAWYGFYGDHTEATWTPNKGCSLKYLQQKAHGFNNYISLSANTRQRSNHRYTTERCRCRIQKTWGLQQGDCQGSQGLCI